MKGRRVEAEVVETGSGARMLNLPLNTAGGWHWFYCRRLHDRVASVVCKVHKVTCKTDKRRTPQISVNCSALNLQTVPFSCCRPENSQILFSFWLAGCADSNFM